MHSLSHICIFWESRICFTATSFSYPHWFCTREIGWDCCHFLCINYRNMDHHAVTLKNPWEENLTSQKFGSCEIDKIWALIPPSLKQMSNFFAVWSGTGWCRKRKFATEGWFEGPWEVNRKSQSWKERRNGKKEPKQTNSESTKCCLLCNT